MDEILVVENGARAAFCTVPLLIISSNCDNKSLVEAIRSGADDYLTIPYKEEMLAARVGGSALQKKPQGRRLASVNSTSQAVRC